MEERSNVLAIDLTSDAETPRGLKRKLYGLYGLTVSNFGAQTPIQT